MGDYSGINSQYFYGLIRKWKNGRSRQAIGSGLFLLDGADNKSDQQTLEGVGHQNF